MASCSVVTAVRAGDRRPHGFADLDTHVVVFLGPLHERAHDRLFGNAAVIVAPRRPFGLIVEEGRMAGKGR